MFIGKSRLQEICLSKVGSERKSIKNKVEDNYNSPGCSKVLSIKINFYCNILFKKIFKRIFINIMFTYVKMSKHSVPLGKEYTLNTPLSYLGEKLRVYNQTLEYQTKLF